MNIVEYLQQTNLGVREISRKTGVAPSTVSRIMRGEVDPTLSTVNKLVEGLGGFTAILPHNENAQITPRSKAAIDEKWDCALTWNSYTKMGNKVSLDVMADACFGEDNWHKRSNALSMMKALKNSLSYSEKERILSSLGDVFGDGWYNHQGVWVEWDNVVDSTPNA